MSTEQSATSASGSAISPTVQTVSVPVTWDREADVVVIGAGATGLPAAIVAREAGASVILVPAVPGILGSAVLAVIAYGSGQGIARAEYLLGKIDNRS